MADTDRITMETIKENGDVDGRQEGQGGDTEEASDELWDIFRKDRFDDDSSMFHGFTDKFFKVIKLLTYGFLFLAPLASVIATRGTLQILTNIIGNEQYYGKESVSQDVVSYFLFFIITIPDALRFLKTLLQVIFGKRQTPTLGHLLTVLIREIGHVIGLFGLLYKVAPSLNPLEFTVVIVTIPAVIGFVHAVAYCGRRRKTEYGWNTRKIVKQLLNLVAMFLLLGLLIGVPVIITQNSTVISSKAEFIGWEIASVVLLSTRWIETYSSRNIGKKGCSIPITSRALEEGHAVVHLCSSFFRLIVAIIVFPTIFCNGIRDINDTFEQFSRQTENVTGFLHETICPNTTISNASIACTDRLEVTLWNVLGPFLVHFLSAMLANHCAVVACKLCMQTFSFSIPLSLASPVYVVILIVLSETNTEVLYDGIGFNTISNEYGVLVGFFIAGWLAQLWICNHVWGSAGEERLAFTRKLFVLPHFVSAYIDLSMLHSRKRKLSAQTSKREDKDTPTPKVYICATMWHENRTEMKQILTSIFRLDLDQFARKANRKLGETDYYEFEAHIPFDDAMETSKSHSNQRTINDFVRQLMEIVEVAGRSFYKKDVNLIAQKYVTPYGGRLEWTLPGQNKLIAHLKDKDKIRHKKRWSQIMYMYYFAGYELMMKHKNEFQGKIPNFRDLNSLFDSNGLTKKIMDTANYTYILALDGDVDFYPEALQLLIDRMKKNPIVGATCGRIKPGGSGPLVWYQRFEYAIGHWLQKSAEHVFGCVLCSPGCFSMFRMKSLMDDNVMRTYASLPTEPKHFLQYDQGEDRWLCTLLLQQGYRIEYCAAAEALTFAPEEFKEFFNQRRRWMPSTMANIWDLLASHSRTTKKNTNISYFYIIYQMVLFFSSILGPSTVLLAMYSAINSVFSIPTWLGYCLVYVPVILFIVACLKLKSNTQLNIAMVLSAVYALLMMAVFVGTLVSIASEGWYTPTGMFMYILVGTFLLAGILHPHEFGDLIWGILYFICIPAGYLFLIIYAICNLNNVSWGTRETQKAVLENASMKKRGKKKEAEDELGNVTSEMIDDMIKQVKETKIANSSCLDSLFSIFRWINNLVILRSLESVQSALNKLKDDEDTSSEAKGVKNLFKKTVRMKMAASASKDDASWAKNDVIGKPLYLEEEESRFWKLLIQKYLYPLDADKKKEQDDKEALAEFRNKMAFGFFFLNALWLTIMSAMTEVKYILNIQISQPSGPPVTIEPLGFVFLVVFTVLLLMQLVGMLIHRYGTLLHIISATKLGKRSDSEESREHLIEMLKDSDIQVDDEDNPIYGDLTDLSIDKDVLHENHRFRKTVRNRRSSQEDPVPPVPRRIPRNKQTLDLRKTLRANYGKARQSQGRAGGRFNKAYRTDDVV